MRALSRSPERGSIKEVERQVNVLKSAIGTLADACSEELDDHKKVLGYYDNKIEQLASRMEAT